MRILVVVPYYPHAGHEFSGVFNERSVLALKDMCEGVTVLAPKPYVPVVVELLPFPGAERWRTYARAKPYEERAGVEIHRPSCLIVPKVGSALWLDFGAFAFARKVARALHKSRRFHAIVSFDLVGAGGLAWRLARDIGIPACGWATGEDVRQVAGSAFEKVVLRSLLRLDLVFYQSQELRSIAETLLKTRSQTFYETKHIVLPRGISEPPAMSRDVVRKRIRSELAVQDGQILVLSIGRIIRNKGVFDLVEAISSAAEKDPRIVCCIVGAKPGFDESEHLNRVISQNSFLRDKIRLFPACPPRKVWELLSAADIYAFPSHREGMPNSLLEAMAMGIPSVAFDIPPVIEIDSDTRALIRVPSFNAKLFAESVLKLASSAATRCQMGEAARALVTKRFMARDNMRAALQQIEALISKQPISL